MKPLFFVCLAACAMAGCQKGIDWQLTDQSTSQPTQPTSPGTSKYLLRIYDQIGDTVRYYYNSDGKVNGFHSDDGDRGTMLYDYVNGRVATGNYNSDLFGRHYSSIESYVYNSKGNVVLVNFTSSSSGVSTPDISYDSLAYDNKGNIQKYYHSARRQPDGSVIFEMTDSMTWDAKGNLTEFWAHGDKQANVAATAMLHFVYTYDDKPNFYNTVGNPFIVSKSWNGSSGIDYSLISTNNVSTSKMYWLTNGVGELYSGHVYKYVYGSDGYATSYDDVFTSYPSGGTDTYNCTIVYGTR